MTVDAATLAAILAMAAATCATRIFGVWIAGRFALRGRLRAAVDAIPGSVLVAVITPSVLGGGAAGMLAGLVTAAAAARLPLIAAVGLGVASAALFRNVL